MYRFFVQPQINAKDNSIYGYEVLLRRKDNQTWYLPKDFTEISVSQQTNLIEDTAKELNSASQKMVLAFNLNHAQLLDPETLGSVITLKKRINPIALTVELTEMTTLEEIKEFSLLLHQYGIGIGIDDVGTGSNTFDNIRVLLPYVDQIKLAMQNLREDGQANEILAYLTFWSQVAKDYHLDVVLEGIEDSQDCELAEQFGIQIYQGYFYGKPSLIHS